MDGLFVMPMEMEMSVDKALDLFRVGGTETGREGREGSEKCRGTKDSTCESSLHNLSLTGDPQHTQHSRGDAYYIQSQDDNMHKEWRQLLQDCGDNISFAEPVLGLFLLICNRWPYRL